MELSDLATGLEAVLKQACQDGSISFQELGPYLLAAALADVAAGSGRWVLRL
ncbi:hypothetical protein [Luteipulveratus mongoliensis]|uniref:hypothetical protein n=1 Tax=Luteipulveratus mongoliensis TaxID=571913 RepID=UPI001FE1E061|nr:hypothetical protein [Luteipulveratus mongoliensis]